MKVLIIGSGGREHTLAWKIAKSSHVTQLICVPGNPGMAQLGECVSLSSENLSELVGFAKARSIDFVVVGPEAPLAMGIVDRCQQEGIKVFGPTQKAAELESSKVFCKNLLKKYDIPTGFCEVFTEVEEAKTYLRRQRTPLVVKADGLAAGKGVIICQTLEEALRAVDEIMVQRVFGEAGSRLLVEEFLVGDEASIIAVTDGRTVVPLVPSQDHKQVYDYDQGPNTGGMGAFSPVPIVSEDVLTFAMEKILKPTVLAMEEEGRPYQGALYAGLMLTKDGPKVLEYNCRFGDPETQVILPRLKSDIIDLLLACSEGTLEQVSPQWSSQSCVCVVMASGGYPGSYEKGKVITGLAEAASVQDTVVFHAGTAMKDKELVTKGGRVLGVTALGEDFEDARLKAYRAVDCIHFDGAHWRTDIGRRKTMR